jgi:predicted nuclease with TOPRIM domain
LKAYNIINQCGPDSLNFIADFNGKSDILKTAIGKFKSLKEVTDLVKTCKEITDKYVTINKSTTAGVTEGTKLNNQLHKAIESLKSIKADDAVAEAQAKARKTYEEIYNKNKKELEFILVVDDSESNPF